MIVDANVALKWFVIEPDSDAAHRLLSSGDALWAPEVILAELANVAWLKIRDEQMDKAVAGELFVALKRLIDVFVPAADLASRALQISIALDHPAYDCFYLALAERERAPLVTADMRLFRKVAGTPFDRLVHPLRGL